jgi:hypothetical protein
VLNGFWYSDIASHAHSMQRVLGASKLDTSSAAIASRTVDVANATAHKHRMAAVQTLVSGGGGGGKSAKMAAIATTKSLRQSNPMAAFLMSASEAVYLACLLAALSLQMAVIGLVLPRSLALVSSLVHTAFLCALSCFDYRWSLEGWSLKHRLRAFERRWAYFLGFGLPMAFVSVALPYFVAVGIYALLFPVMVLLAMVARPHRTHSMARLPFFGIVDGMLLRTLVGCCRTRKTASPPPITRKVA